MHATGEQPFWGCTKVKSMQRMNLQYARWHFFPDRTIMVDWALTNHLGDCYSGWIRSGLLFALLFDSLGWFRMRVLVFRMPVDQVFTVVDVLLMMAHGWRTRGFYRRPTTSRDVTPSATVVWCRSAQWAWSQPRMARGWSLSPGKSQVSTKKSAVGQMYWLLVLLCWPDFEKGQNTCGMLCVF